MGCCSCGCKKVPKEIEYIAENSNLSYTYTITGMATVGKLKDQLDGQLYGIPKDNMKIVLNGKELNDDSKFLVQVGFAAKGTKI